MNTLRVESLLSNETFGGIEEVTLKIKRLGENKGPCLKWIRQTDSKPCLTTLNLLDLSHIMQDAGKVTNILSSVYHDLSLS